MQKYICRLNDFKGIDLANEIISKIPASVRQELNFMIDIDFVSNSDQIENINANMPLVDFLNNPNIKVLRSTRLLNPQKPEEKIFMTLPNGEPLDDDLPKDYIDYLRETNLVIFDTETNEEYYVETTGHLAAVAETINEARRARRAIKNGKNLPLDAEFIADHINAHILGADYGRYRSEYYFDIVGLYGCDWCVPGGDKVDKEMNELLDWYNNHSQGLHPIVRAAILHAEFVRIHPFADGNGRTARLLSNYELVKNGYPTITIKAKNRQAYVDALNEAIINGDITNLVELFAKRMISRQRLYHKKLLEYDLDREMENE